MNQQPSMYQHEPITETQQIAIAQKLSKQGKLETAKQMLLNIFNNNSNNCNPKVLIGLGRVSEKLQNLDDALIYYHLYHSINDKDNNINHRMATIYFQSNQLTQAENMYQHIITINEFDTWSIYNLGKIKEKCNDYDKAREFYEKAIKVGDKNREKPHKMAMIYHRLGLLMIKYDEIGDALYALNEARIKNPENIQYQNDYEICLEKMDKKKMDDLGMHILDDNDYKSIKRVVFHFESTLLFISDLIPNMDEMKDREIITRFGGNDRINRLFMLLNKLTDYQIKLTLFHHNHEQVVMKLLSAVNLNKFFDSNAFINGHLEQIKKYADIKKEEILYIDKDENRTQNACMYCKIIMLNSDNILPGLTLVDIEHIECRFHMFNSASSIYDTYNFPYSRPESMIKEEQHLYNCIKTEIQMNHQNYNKYHSPATNNIHVK